MDDVHIGLVGSFVDAGHRVVVEIRMLYDAVLGGAGNDSLFGGAGNDSLRVWVRYEIEEGSQYRIGEINIHTSDFPVRVDSTLIRRELLLRPGEIYRRTFMVRTWERLYDTGLFSQVQITPLVNSDSARIGFDIALRERRPRWLDAGIGSGTAERYRGTVEWGHRNLMGRDGKRRVVYVERADGAFEPREVQTGQNRNGRVVIVQGLTAGERIVVRGALLLDTQAEQLL